MRKAVLVGLTLALLLAPGMVQAGMWISAEGGANFTASTSVNIAEENEKFTPVKREPAALGGLMIGYDFVKEGFLGYNYPDWMKYFSFVTDVTYNKAEVRKQLVTETEGGGAGWHEFFGPFEAELVCWSFMLKFRYGFFPDSEVPFGRLQPYLMVGPGILFSSARGANEEGWYQFHASSVDVALVTEAGLRWMCLKNVSMDAGFRFRWAEPKYTIPHEGTTTTMKTQYQLFTAMFRVSYHF
jgi:opacity protein-like surface antigen